MQNNIAIIVATYNRPDSLHRLLMSLSGGDYSGYTDIPLIISIDKNNDNSCLRIAKEFIWNFGKKEIIEQENLLGLKNHILSCGDLTQRFDGLILLEDDLLVSSGFYDFAQQSFTFYKDDLNVAGIGLYANCFNETAYCTFDPIEDGFDNYFMQVPCSWGQLWTKLQWQGFRNFIEDSKLILNEIQLPETVSAWSDSTSWKKIFYKYIIVNNLYFVYPRVGFSTNYAEPGSHIKEPVTVFQANLLLNKKEMRFSSFHQSVSIYDAYFEFTTLAYQRFSGKKIDVSFDLNGTKPLREIQSEYLISSKLTSDPEIIYDSRLYPYENNVLLEMLSSDISNSFILAKTKSFSEKNRFQRTDADIRKYFISKEILIQKLAIRKTTFFTNAISFLKTILSSKK